MNNVRERGTFLHRGLYVRPFWVLADVQTENSLQQNRATVFIASVLKGPVRL